MPGAFDVAYLGCLPGFVVMAAADEAELVHMVATQAAIDDRPSALRYPRGEGIGRADAGGGHSRSRSARAACCARAPRSRCSRSARGLRECLKAADELAALGLSTTVADARFAKPLDTDLLLRLAREHEVLITIEEGAIGGFGAHVLQTLAEHGVLDGGLKVRSMVLPDIFIDQDSPAAMYAKAGLDAKGIVAKAFEALGQNLRGEAVRHRTGVRASARPADFLPLRGTFFPLRRASERPMAMACLRLFTFLPLLPLLSVPRLRLRIARSTSFEAPREYFRAMVLLGPDPSWVEPRSAARATASRREQQQTAVICSSVRTRDLGTLRAVRRFVR